MQKAVREAKERTTWTDPNQAYENGLQRFIENILNRTSENQFLPDFDKFQRLISFFGYLNSLSQTALKIAAPGVPDFYQGTELWDFSLVDPDNRRSVDYEKRNRLLTRIKEEVAQKPRSQLARELLESMPCDELKLYVTWQGLQARREREQLYAQGEYIPVDVSGKFPQHLCAFLRRWNASEIVVIVPRLVCTLVKKEKKVPLGQEVWSDTYLSWPGAQTGQQFRDRFTGRIVTVEEEDGKAGLKAGRALSDFPIALLESAG
jgi:(1->4)-alpha-D-glucan 1-alpha-D-glucosylmutase